MSKFGLFFLLTFAIGVYSILFIAPVYGFYLYELIYFLNPSKRWWGAGIPSISYSFVTVLFTLGMFFLKRKEHNINTISKMPEAKWFLLLFLIYLLVSFSAVSSYMHNKFVFDLFKLYLVLFLAYRLVDTYDKLTVAVFIYILGCAYIGYEAMNVGRNNTGRVEGIGTLDAPGANGISAAMVPAIPLVLYFVWRAKMKLKFVAILFGALIANGLILINSRGAFLGVVMGLAYSLFFIIFSKYKLPKQRLALVAMLIVGLSGVIRFTDDLFWTRMATIIESSVENEEESGAGRVQFWLKTFEMLEEKPFGLGIWGYQIMSPMYLSETQMANALREGHTGRSVHSMWFQGLAEVGYVGMLIFFMLLISTKLHVSRAKKLAIKHSDYNIYYFLISLEGSFIAFLAAGSFIDAFRAEIFYWLLMFCIIGATVASSHFSSDPDTSASKGLVKK